MLKCVIYEFQKYLHLVIFNILPFNKLQCNVQLPQKPYFWPSVPITEITPTHIKMQNAQIGKMSSQTVMSMKWNSWPWKCKSIQEFHRLSIDLFRSRNLQFLIRLVRRKYSKLWLILFKVVKKVEQVQWKHEIRNWHRGCFSSNLDFKI